MMIRLIIFCFLLVSTKCIAQKNYVITISGDTLTGKVSRGNMSGDYLTLKNASAKKRFHLRELKEWKSGTMPVIVVPIKSTKREYWLELLLVVDGKKKLFNNLHYNWHYDYYIEHDGRYTALTENNINSILLKELKKCEAFSKQYASTQSLKLSEAEKVMKSYNQLCANNNKN